METVISMFTAFIIISIILVSGTARTYFRHKFNIDEHVGQINEAVKRQETAKKRLHDVQH